MAEVSERHGIVFILTLVCLGLGWLFLQERRDNRILYDKILENGKELTAVALEVQATVAGFKETLIGFRETLSAVIVALKLEG